MNEASETWPDAPSRGRRHPSVVVRYCALDEVWKKVSEIAATSAIAPSALAIIRWIERRRRARAAFDGERSLVVFGRGADAG
ncbi:MAG: hypothetical protein ACP5PB_11105, partial [Acidimicrobiales bacterium]